VITDKMRQACYKRSYSRCEAMVRLPSARRQFVEDSAVWTRCGMPNVEVHHALTRSRGGGILDEVGEDYHLIVLCPGCHRQAEGASAYEGGLLLSGYVSWNSSRTWPVYDGPDEYLSVTYPKEDHGQFQGLGEGVSERQAGDVAA
jgi:hypothetical protein